MLERLDFAGRNAPLAGDLLEEFGNGRSALWFWRQTLTVIANCVSRRAAILRIYWIALVAGYSVYACLPQRMGSLGKSRHSCWRQSAWRWSPGWAVDFFGATSKDVKSILVKPGAESIE